MHADMQRALTSFIHNSTSTHGETHQSRAQTAPAAVSETLASIGEPITAVLTNDVTQPHKTYRLLHNRPRTHGRVWLHA